MLVMMIINYKVELMEVRNKYKQGICLRYWNNISWEESCWELMVQTYRQEAGAHKTPKPKSHTQTHTHTHTHEYTICTIMWNWQVLPPLVAETTGNHKTFYHAQIIITKISFHYTCEKNYFVKFMLKNKKSEIRKLLVNQYFPSHLLVRENVGWC